MVSIEKSEVEQILCSPEYYRDNGYRWATWETLRREAPVFRVDDFRIPPHSMGSAYILTEHADMMDISRDPGLWIQGPDMHRPPDDGVPRRTIIGMDPPDHAVYRNLVNRRFTPRQMNHLAPSFDA